MEFLLDFFNQTHFHIIFVLMFLFSSMIMIFMTLTIKTLSSQLECSTARIESLSELSEEWRAKFESTLIKTDRSENFNCERVVSELNRGGRKIKVSSLTTLDDSKLIGIQHSFIKNNEVFTANIINSTSRKFVGKISKLDRQRWSESNGDSIVYFDRPEIIAAHVIATK